MIILLGAYFRSFGRHIASDFSIKSPWLYCYLGILVFLVQGLVSWPLHSPSLLATFLAFVGLLLSRGELVTVRPSTTLRIILVFLMVSGVVLAGALMRQEIGVNQLPDRFAKSQSLLANIEYAKELSYNPHNEYYVLSKALPILIRDVLKADNAYLANHLLPMAERSVMLEGGYWQWLGLSRLYHLAGFDSQALEAVATAISRQPAFEPAWKFQHYLNMLDVARKTDRPLETLLPQNSPDLEIPERGN
jgi:hypothetical protein